MREQEVRELYEAYLQVHQPQEEVEQLDEAMSSYDRNRQRAAQRAAARNEARKQGKTGNVPGVGYVSPRPERETYRDSAGTERHKTGARMPKKEDQKESFDLFDYILEHLVSEGYADTNESALVIMANMSEEWRQSILDESLLDVARGVGKVAGNVGNVAKDVKDRVTGKKELIGGPQGYIKVGGPSKPGDVKVSGIGPVGTYGRRTTPTGTNSPAATMSMRAR